MTVKEVIKKGFLHYFLYVLKVKFVHLINLFHITSCVCKSRRCLIHSSLSLKVSGRGHVRDAFHQNNYRKFSHIITFFYTTWYAFNDGSNFVRVWFFSSTFSVFFFWARNTVQHKPIFKTFLVILIKDCYQRSYNRLSCSLHNCAQGSWRFDAFEGSSGYRGDGEGAMDSVWK